MLRHQNVESYNIIIPAFLSDKKKKKLKKIVVDYFLTHNVIKNTLNRISDIYGCDIYIHVVKTTIYVIIPDELNHFPWDEACAAPYKFQHYFNDFR